MRIGFVVNDIKTEEAGYTTTRLGVAATNRGHEAWTISVGDLAYDPDELVKAKATRPPKARYKDGVGYLPRPAWEERHHRADHGRRP